MDFSKVEIGVNSAEVQNYLNKIKADVIDQAKDLLVKQQDELFATFKANWQGISEKNFETNMTNATNAVMASLETHYNALSSKMIATNNSWVNQDEQMVQVQGGNN